MKRKLVLVPILIGMFITLSGVFALKAAVKITIGPQVWYHNWNPIWQRGKFYLPSGFSLGMKQTNPVTFLDLLSTPMRIRDFTSAPGQNIMGGASGSISFSNGWYTSLFAMFGRFTAVSSGRIASFQARITHLRFSAYSSELDFPLFFPESRYNRKIFKYDSAVTAGKKIFRFLKFFLGFKYQGYHYDEQLNYITYNNKSDGSWGGLNADGKSNFRNLGPGLGLGFTIGVTKNWYLLLNFTASFLYGSAEYSFDKFLLIEKQVGQPGSINAPLQRIHDEHFYSVAGNSSISFAYTIPQTHITLVFGGRYQIIYYFYQESTVAGYIPDKILNYRSTTGFLDYEGKAEQFYGASLAALYSFKIGG